MVELELHDEIVVWIDTLGETERNRTVVVIDQLARLGSSARMLKGAGTG